MHGDLAAPPWAPAEATGAGVSGPRCQTMPKNTVAMAASQQSDGDEATHETHRVAVPVHDVSGGGRHVRLTFRHAQSSSCAVRLSSSSSAGKTLSMTACDSSCSRAPTAPARRRRHGCWPRICARSDARSSRCASPAAPRPGERVRTLLLDSAAPLAARTEAMLFAAARAQLVEDVIAPALARGATVIADRYIGSSLVYQGVVRGLGSRGRARGQRLRHRRARARRDGADRGHRRAGGRAARPARRRSLRARADRVPPQA